MAQADLTSNQPRKHPLLSGAVFIFLLLTLAAFITLGSWQVQRMGWKRDLIERVESRTKAEPASPPSYLQWQESADSQAQYEYQRVTLTGHFLHDKEVQVYANSLLGPGYWVMTPLETTSDIIWVNRGFVPNDKRNPQTRPESLSSELVTVIGLLRLSEPNGMFVRDNVPAENRWYHRNLTDFSNAKQFDRTAPYFVDADATPNPGGWPRGGLTVINFRDNHLTYALTWFGLAILNMLALIFFVRTELRGGNRSRATEDDE